MDLKFGTSGLRGLATDLTRDVCHLYVGAFLDLLANRGQLHDALCIGRDLRPSSPEIAAWCAEAAAARGIGVVNAGTVPTPAVARYALMRGLPAIMVTASHNPVAHNGLKFYRPDGELMKDDEAPIQALVAAGAPLSVSTPFALPQAQRRVATEYVESYVSLFPADCLKGLRLGIDQHSAVGGMLLLEVLTALGADCTVVRRSDSFIAVDTEALEPSHLALAEGWLRDGGYDAIVSTDGDGDRPLLLNAEGRQVPGDVLGILAARYLGYNHVVTPVSSTSAVERCGVFDSVERTRIGSPFVIAAMQQRMAETGSAVAGFEGNGGFLTGGNHAWRGRTLAPLMTRDAILPLLAVLAMAREWRISLVDLVARLPAGAKATGRLADIDTARARSWIDTLVASERERSRAIPVLSGTTEIVTLDGAKFLLGDGSSIHFRLSGNAPELRCYVECPDAGRANAQLMLALDVARASLADRAMRAV